MQSLAMAANDVEVSLVQRLRSFNQLINCALYLKATNYAIDQIKAKAGCEAVRNFNLAADSWLRRIPSHLSFDSEHDVKWMMIQSRTLANYFYQCQVRDHPSFRPRLRVR